MKTIGLKFLFLLVIVLAGCGSQDRYEVVTPRIGAIVEDENWGTATALPTVHNSFDPCPLAVVDGRYYFGSRGGMVYAATDTEFETLPRYQELFVRDLLEGPDGLLWMTDYYGNILYFQNGQWVYDKGLEMNWDHTTRLLADDRGGILVYGNSDGMWRRDQSGQWIEQNLPEITSVVHGWCEHGLPPVFLTWDLRILTQGLNGWELSEPLLEGIDSWDLEFQSSRDGRQVIRVSDGEYFLLNEGGGWEIKETGTRLRHLFWLNNELYGMSRYNTEVLHWDGSNWTTVCNAGVYANNRTLSLSNDSGRILNFGNGESWLFDGVSATRKTKRLGYPIAFVRHGGFDHLLMSEGQHIQGIDGIWEEVGRPFANEDRSSIALKMLVDDEDYLTFVGSDKFIRWDGNSYRNFPAGDDIRRSYLQDDGRVVVFSNQKAGVWAGGEIRWLGYTEEGTSGMEGARLEPDDNILILYSTHLRQFSPVQSTITITFQGWSPFAAAAGVGRSMACAGRERVVVVDGTSVEDITPIWGTIYGQAARISTIIPDGFGGWLAYDYDRSSLMKYDGERWLDMGQNFWTTIVDGGILTSNGDGTFILRDYGFAFLIEPGVGQ